MERPLRKQLQWPPRVGGHSKRGGSCGGERRKEPEGGCGVERKTVRMQAQFHVSLLLESPCLTYKDVVGAGARLLSFVRFSKLVA